MQNANYYEKKLVEINLNNKIAQLNEQIKVLNADIENLKTEMQNKNSFIASLKQDLHRKEDLYFYKIKDLNHFNEEIANTCNILKAKLQKSEKEISDILIVHKKFFYNF